MSSATTHQPRVSSGLTGATRILAAIFDRLARLGDQDPRMQRATKLNALTDEQLAKRGLSRAGIARHVFGDRFYI